MKRSVACFNNFKRSSVSDTASQNASSDRSGPTIRETLENRQLRVYATAIVPDDEHKIASVVAKWASEGVDWIISTGGTGFGVRDRTPEVSVTVYAALLRACCLKTHFQGH